MIVHITEARDLCHCRVISEIKEASVHPCFTWCEIWSRRPVLYSFITQSEHTVHKNADNINKIFMCQERIWFA